MAKRIAMWICGAIASASLIFWALGAYLESQGMISKEQAFWWVVVSMPLLFLVAPLSGIAAMILLILTLLDLSRGRR